MDIPKNVVRWYIKKTREDVTGAFSASFDSYRQSKNGTTEISSSQLANGKTRLVIKHSFQTQADLDGYLALLEPYVAERDAYHAANNIVHSDAITTE